jgi:hypothetical protein
MRATKGSHLVLAGAALAAALLGCETGRGRGAPSAEDVLAAPGEPRATAASGAPASPAFEWTSNPNKRNLHRVVPFRNSRVVPELAYSAFDSDRPEDLWRWMDEQRTAGATLLAVPHNANASDGLMLSLRDSDGNPLGAARSEARRANEPVYEITQIKGTSETHPDLSPDDEFSGWDFEHADAERADWVGARPALLVRPSKDPASGHLDRIQIVKGWVDAAGGPHEAIDDVAWSGGRRIDAKTGKLPPVGSTVNAPTATYTSEIGAPELAAVWSDPDFDASQRAFYYARVLEVPTPRWSTRDAVALGVAVPEGLPASIQERALSSPIWYTP